MWHTSVKYKNVPDKIKNPVPRKRRGHDPQVLLEPKNSAQRKSASHQDFDYEYARGTAHHCEQHVVRSDYDQHDGIESAIAVKTAGPRESDYANS